ncbi:MAG: hypothetical protein H6604_05635 [Flavobacteriales bacterium]|nr:hypothetical protein [Flavobacteriales bacterium]
MKYVVALTLIIIFSLPSLQKIWIVIDFKINQDFIAEVLCINKEKPEKHCNGKCYLAKELEKSDEENDKKQPKEVSKKKIEFNFICPDFQIDLPRKSRITKKKFYTFKNIPISSYSEELFHPPELRCI